MNRSRLLVRSISNVKKCFVSVENEFPFFSFVQKRECLTRTSHNPTSQDGSQALRGWGKLNYSSHIELSSMAFWLPRVRASRLTLCWFPVDDNVCRTMWVFVDGLARRQTLISFLSSLQCPNLTTTHLRACLCWLLSSPSPLVRWWVLWGWGSSSQCSSS